MYLPFACTRRLRSEGETTVSNIEHSFSTRLFYQAFLPGFSTRLFYQAFRPGFSTRLFYQAFLPGFSTRLFYQAFLPGFSTRLFYQAFLPGFSTRLFYQAFLPGFSTRLSSQFDDTNHNCAATVGGQHTYTLTFRSTSTCHLEYKDNFGRS
ncbi:hypothetical protein BgiBS90_033184 [Biomphalaria glabrata]|nr:hypothetical protein BgiBS90_033184 [Biomphalaria glabrata]